MIYDIAIIGAGIIGSLVADRLSKYDSNIVVLERLADSGLEQSMSSSAIVHSGIDPKDGTLKKELNIAGNRMMEQLCQELNVDYLQCGGYICAHNKAEEQTLFELKMRADQRGIPAQIITGDELRAVEPNASNTIISCLSMPTTGVVYPVEITIAAIERAMNNRVVVAYDTEVRDIIYADGLYNIATNHQAYNARLIVNCCGMMSDQIAKMVDPKLEIESIPKRGTYFVTDNKQPVVKSVMYPVPNENGKGVLAVPTTHGNVLLGPNGVIQEDRHDDSVIASDLKYVQDNVTRVIEQFPNDIIKNYVGIRSTGNNGDFYIEYCKQTGAMINAICIDSPGIASSPAIAKLIEKMVLAKQDLKLDDDYEPDRQRYFDLKQLSIGEQNKRITQNSDYGKIICRCEKITEGEIRDAIRKQNGARDLTGIKFRIRPMLGMCQGGFCETEVVRILADELDVPINQITRRGPGTIVIQGGNDD